MSLSPSKRTPPPRDPRHLTQARILGMAQRLFVGHGFQHTTMAEIAKAAGLEERALLVQVKTKKELLGRLFDRIEYELIYTMAERVALSGPSAKDKLIAILDERIVLARSYVSDTLLRILMSLEFADPAEELGRRVRILHSHLVRTVEGVIELGKMRGHFRNDLGTPELAATVVAAHDGMLLEYHRSGGTLDGPQLVKTLQFALLRGIEERHDPSDYVPRGLPGAHP